MPEELVLLILLILISVPIVAIMARLVSFFRRFHENTKSICHEINCADTDESYRYWRRELRCHYLTLIPFVSKGNVKTVYDFFDQRAVFQKGERRDSIVPFMMPSVVGIIVCLVCVCGMTWAWYSASVNTPTQKMTSAYYGITVESVIAQKEKPEAIVDVQSLSTDKPAGAVGLDEAGQAAGVDAPKTGDDAVGAENAETADQAVGVDASKISDEAARADNEAIADNEATAGVDSVGMAGQAVGVDDPKTSDEAAGVDNAEDAETAGADSAETAGAANHADGAEKTVRAGESYTFEKIASTDGVYKLEAGVTYWITLEAKGNVTGGGYCMIKRLGETSVAEGTEGTGNAEVVYYTQTFTPGEKITVELVPAESGKYMFVGVWGSLPAEVADKVLTDKTMPLIPEETGSVAESSTETSTEALSGSSAETSTEAASGSSAETSTEASTESVPGATDTSSAEVPSSTSTDMTTTDVSSTETTESAGESAGESAKTESSSEETTDKETSSEETTDEEASSQETSESATLESEISAQESSAAETLPEESTEEASTEESSTEESAADETSAEGSLEQGVSSEDTLSDEGRAGEADEVK